jgi:uncharacterized phiE125 gp8 family phage protein
MHEMTTIRQLIAPASEPITLSDAKNYLRVETSEDDSLIADCIVSARQIAEHTLRRSLITQDWRLSTDAGVLRSLALPMGPVQSVLAAHALNREGVATSISASSYTLNAAADRLMFDGMPYYWRVEIDYRAGYGVSGSSIPAAIRQGMLNHLAMLYDGRGVDAGMPESTATLYHPYRVLAI